MLTDYAEHDTAPISPPSFGIYLTINRLGYAKKADPPLNTKSGVSIASLRVGMIAETSASRSYRRLRGMNHAPMRFPKRLV